LEEVVLDSSVIVKAVLRPGHWLPSEIYKRELETHDKARALIKILRKRQVRVLIPYPVIVETAAVITRLADRKLAVKVIESLKSTKNYVIAYEEEYRDKALQVALNTGSSGLDAYIIALAWSRDALLVTDDESMSKHAEKLGIDVVLLRKVSLKDLLGKFEKA
jgi:predicted nucleic acid-binding protein